MKNFNPKIPILMYHEVSSRRPDSSGVNRLTPLYDLSVETFENHLRLLSEGGYTTLHFDDVQELKKDGRYVILTFDDGLKGNFIHAFPILKKYDFKATIFIATDNIGTERFMDWRELAEMARHGISIQSHTKSHRPLHTLNFREAFSELDGSKKRIEGELRSNVHAISFPHGSYNQETVKIARDSGYKYICTSNVECVYYDTFLDKSVILGRIAVTSKMNESEYLKLLEYDRAAILKYKISKNAKKTAKRLIGIKRYRELYRWFFKIKVDKK